MPERINENHQPVRVLVVVEGTHDIEFLTRISTLLHAEHLDLPDLATMEGSGELIFLPISGHPQVWISRLAPLNLPEFHLSDREQSPVTEQRQTIVAAINQRDRCCAMLTKKRSLENYLHPQAVQAIAGAALDYGDHDCVATVAAQQIFESSHGRPNWKQLNQRAQV